MPTIFEREGFAFRIWRNDHEPAHVHAAKAGGVLIVELGESAADVVVRASYGMKRGAQRRAVKIAREEWTTLKDAWRRIHGNG